MDTSVQRRRIMTPDEVLALAKEGHPKILNAIMNRSTRSHGIDVRVVQKEGCLHILLEGEAIASSSSLIAFVEGSLNKLNVNPDLPVKVYGRQRGQKTIAWSQDLRRQVHPHPSEISDHPDSRSSDAAYQPATVNSSSHPFSNEPPASTESDSATPDITASDITASDVAAPDVAAPDVAAPDAMTLDATAPDATAPINEPEASIEETPPPEAEMTGDTSSEELVSEELVSEELVSEELVSEELVSRSAVPEAVALGNIAAEDGTADNTADNTADSGMSSEAVADDVTIADRTVADVTVANVTVADITITEMAADDRAADDRATDDRAAGEATAEVRQDEASDEASSEMSPERPPQDTPEAQPFQSASWDIDPWSTAADASPADTPQASPSLEDTQTELSQDEDLAPEARSGSAQPDISSSERPPSEPLPDEAVTGEAVQPMPDQSDAEPLTADKPEATQANASQPEAVSVEAAQPGVDPSETAQPTVALFDADQPTAEDEFVLSNALTATEQLNTMEAIAPSQPTEADSVDDELAMALETNMTETMGTPVHDADANDADANDADANDADANDADANDADIFEEQDGTASFQDMMKRPEALVILLFAIALYIWQLYTELATRAAPEGSVSGRELAKRLGVSKSMVNRWKRQPDFAQWSASQDPDGIAWAYESGVFVPQMPDFSAS